ncbi:DUF1264-domain-containing protein [Cristinia sonorae]|uniref:DUF1264-domain-containing protein n=1 Tax=Cristinia sonorae TaxID=1940300 RepID=A0A8K0XUB2_9AGAR|nr:DUF1264-domain-containing protein [Cristinia sonorae]
MDTESKRSQYHTATYQASGSAMMSFTPINAIHQHLCAFHVYSTDHTRHVRAHHFCMCRSKDFHQCIIYDSEQPDARLIGIEYIVSEKVFKDLSEDEKRYWHSHKYEVESGLLQLRTKALVPAVAVDTAEQPAMLELQQTYGKTIHTWAYDTHPELPLGPPSLMMAYTGDGQGPPPALLKERDAQCGMDTAAKKQLRAGYLPAYETVQGSDAWVETGKAVLFEPVEREIQKQ